MTAFVDGAVRVTVKIYDLVVTPSWAVTNVVIVFWPTANGIGADVAPDNIATPFTVNVAVVSWTMAVKVTELTV
jgi:hypothetical protein